MARLILPYQRVEDLNGHPLPGAKIYFYEPATVTPKDTYSDEALTIPNANPVIADSQGQFGDIFLSGAYSVKLDDADDVTQPDYPAEIAATVDTAASVLLTGAQTVAGVKTFTDRTANKADTPTYELEENDGPANNRIYQMIAAAEQFILRVANDARDAFTNFMEVDRTDNTVDTINFISTNLQHNGANIVGTGVSPSFSAHRDDVDQSIPAGANTKIEFDTEDWDSTNDYDATTNYRFTPSELGKYIVVFRAHLPILSTGNTIYLQIRKNGAIYKDHRLIIGYSSSWNGGLTMSALADMNGTTDYLEVYVWHDFGGAANLEGLSSDSYFQANKVSL